MRLHVVNLIETIVETTSGTTLELIKGEVHGVESVPISITPVHNIYMLLKRNNLLLIKQ